MSADGMIESKISDEQESAGQDLYSILGLIYPKATTRLKNVLKAAEKNHKLYGIDTIKIKNNDKNVIDRLRAAKIGIASITELKEIISNPSLLESADNNETISDLTQVDVGQILLEDVEGFLESLGSRDRDQVMERWGYFTERQILDTLGEKYGGVNKDQIRIRMKGFERDLRKTLRIKSQMLLEYLLELSLLDFQTKFVELSYGFENREKDFIRFIETLCGCKESGEIWDVFYPSTDNKKLGLYFAENSSPVELETFTSDIASEYGYEKNVAINAIKNWENSGLVKVVGNLVSPIKLGKIEAAAHILLNHPNGLPWSDIAKSVNSRGCSRKPFDESRLIHTYLGDSEHVYLYGSGTYRHLKFLARSEYDTKLIMSQILEYFEKKDCASIHLEEFYNQASNEIRAMGYYDIRHIVSTSGVDFGIFFEGQSREDSLGLEANFKHGGQQQVIIDAMNRFKGAMTKSEIAERLRSKSLGHAGFYLDKMMGEDLVVKIDSMMYTTPEKAFKDIDCEEILKLIDEIIKGVGKIVEVDSLRVKINDQLGLINSKHWYAALASINLKKYGWFKNYNLFSCNEIPYVSLIECCTHLCDPNEPNSVNLERLQKEILITEAAARVVLNNWKIGRNNS